MDQSSGNKKYSSKDIERYHAGKMSATEMHALEKAAMNDPFLADALEGYTFTTNAQSDLDKIKSRLAEKSQDRKVVPLFSKTWIRVAAVVLVLGVGGWLLTSRMQSEKNQLASVPAEKVLPPNDSSSFAKGAANIKDNSDSFSNFIKPGQGITPENDVVASSGRNRKSTSQELSPPGAERKKSDANEVIVESQLTDSSLKKQSSFSVAAPSANKNETRQLASKSASANFYRDSQGAYKDETSGYVAGVKVGDTLKHLDVTMKPIPESVQEVVVTSSQQKSKEYLLSNIVVDTLEPAIGWVKYDDYVATNIRIPEDIRQKEVSGVVQLSFDVDKNGLATNIKVEKSLCDRCDQEAIRLLKEGPKWTRKKNKKGKLTVKF